MELPATSGAPAARENACSARMRSGVVTVPLLIVVGAFTIRGCGTLPEARRHPTTSAACWLRPSLKPRAFIQSYARSKSTGS